MAKVDGTAVRLLLSGQQPTWTEVNVIVNDEASFEIILWIGSRHFDTIVCYLRLLLCFQNLGELSAAMRRLKQS
jgi:hypothetical protein